MAKATPLGPELMTAPDAIATPRAVVTRNKPAKAPKVTQLPLQIRLPRDQVRAIKIAAAEREQTISDFMLACFHDYMTTKKHA